MVLGSMINRIRTEAKLTQAQFAAIFEVSQQAVQRWESDLATPDLDKIIRISKYFDVSLDALLMGNDNRVVEEMRMTRVVKPQYQSICDWESYSSNLQTEYQQSLEEGLDVEKYKEIFFSISRLPKGEIKKKFGDVLFEVVQSAPQREGYPYIEPSDLETIRALRQQVELPATCDPALLPDKLEGAWLGRVCGCMLGKTVEGIYTDELVPFLKETGNYPLSRYIRRSDVTDETIRKYRFGFAGRAYGDTIHGMPVDDDTNYVVLAQRIVSDYGRQFTPENVAQAWLRYQSKDSYCTAERVAFCNFVKGYAPPESAVYKNPYREWIGAQIRGDYYGYINPGDPSMAAEMAWRDASISHVKNGIYGEMFVAAMLAAAAVTDDLETIIRVGLGEVPATSRLYESVMGIVEAYRAGVSHADCFARIHQAYDEHSPHGWCHTVANAMIVAASLLYGRGNYGRSICMAVETGFDTDCNGATVGSIVGLARGRRAISSDWSAPIDDTLHTSIFGVGTVRISACAQATLSHIPGVSVT